MSMGLNDVSFLTNQIIEENEKEKQNKKPNYA